MRTEYDELYSASVVKGDHKYVYRRADGRATILKDVKSEVQLHVPDDVCGLIVGHAHTSFRPFLDYVPRKECFVSPIPEYHFIPDEGKDEGPAPWFTIQIPHRIKSKILKSIRVRHGDIHKNVPFKLVPKQLTVPKGLDVWYKVTNKNVILYTTHFSQFVCTTCEKSCKGQVKTMVFGSLFPYNNDHVTTVSIHMGSTLYDIADFRKVHLIFCFAFGMNLYFTTP